MISKEELEQLYWKEELTMKQIGKKLSKSTATIWNWMKKYNIPKRSIKEAAKLIPPKITKNKLQKLYLEEKLSLNKIGKKLGCSRYTIHYWLKKYDIPRRNISEASKGKILSNKTKIKISKSMSKLRETTPPGNINGFIFKGLNKDLSYILGVRFGDGYITKGKKGKYIFEVRAKDKEFIQEVYNSLKNINLRTRFSFTHYDKLYYARVFSVEFYNWLKQIDVNWLKENINTQELQKAFIKGFYDSEGSLYKDNRGYLTLSMYNSNNELLGFIEQILKNMNYSINIYKFDRRGEIVKGRNIFTRRKIEYTLRVGKQQGIKRFCQEIGSSIPRKVGL